MASELSTPTPVADTPVTIAPKRRVTAFLVARLCLYAAVFGLYVYLTNEELYNIPGHVDDLTNHIMFANRFFAGHYPDAYPGIYLLWFVVSRVFQISIANATIFVDPLLAVAVVVIIRNVLAYAGFSKLEQLIFTVILMVVTPIYVPFFSPNIYLGQISANIYHNPTLLAVKPFAYASLLLYVQGLRRGTSFTQVIWTALAVVVSLIMKPNFVLAFMPALVAFLILRRPPLNQWVKVAIIGVLVVATLAVQYVITYQQASDSSHVIFDYLAVWNLFTPDPLFSVLISLAFPLSVLAFRWRQVWQNDFLVLSWLGLGVAIAQFALFAEAGTRFENGNFSWGMQTLIPLVFLFSIVELVRWARDNVTPGIRGIPGISGIAGIRSIPGIRSFHWGVYLAGLFLVLHFMSGVIYLGQIILTGTYFIGH